MNTLQGKPDSGFRSRVEDLVAQIPQGKVMTYGQIAVLCGSPRSARIVGGIAHFGNPDLSWHRVVMKDGSLARGYPGGLEGHKQALISDGIAVSADYKLKDMQSLIWHPEKSL